MTAEGAFCTTSWTLVCNARGDSHEARQALGELSAAYYAPVHSYIAHTCRDLGESRDLAQEFFARLLSGSMMDGANQDRGRFRAYLLGAVKHFLADMRDRHTAAKRGAAHEHTPIETGADTSAGFEIPAPEANCPDALFDREWGLAILEQALSALATEHEAQGKAAQFAVLKQWLTGDLTTVSQAQAAEQLGMTEGGLKAAIHRLRQRFRASVKAQIAQTVSSEEEVRDELRYMIQVVS